MTPAGLPHSEIPGSKPANGSPRLIAASHVLHRLLAPRHPPFALSSLTINSIQLPMARNHPCPRHTEFSALVTCPYSIVKEQVSSNAPELSPGSKLKDLGFGHRSPQPCASRLGGADRDRTDDLLVANQALSQLSYSPECFVSGGPR
jgi:hypothetical protein